MELAESVKTMAAYLPQDIRRARPYIGRKLRQVTCAPLDLLTDDYLHEKGWTVEVVFPPVAGLALDPPANSNALIVVIQRKARQK